LVHYPKFPYNGDPTWRSPEQKALSDTKRDYFPELRSLDVEFVAHDFKDYNFTNEAHEVHKSDILRWLVLSKTGGVWSDIDILYIKSMESITDNTLNNMDGDTGLCPYPNGNHSIGFLMSSTNNYFFNALYLMSLHSFNKKEYQSIGATLLNLNFNTKNIILGKFPEANPFYINCRGVYSIDCFNNNILKFFITDTNFNDPPDVIGYHWYAGHYVSQQFENMLTPENYMDFLSPISKIIAKVLEK
jgi:hypothetical protein